MSYFGSEFFLFFNELSLNNSTDWFHSNKKRYEDAVKNPFKLFVEEMIDRIRVEEPGIDMTAKDAIFRINRDIRFSKDKSPYKTLVAANISEGGRKSIDSPGFYFSFSSNQVVIAGGFHCSEKEGIYKIRTEIANFLDNFLTVFNDQNFKNKFETIRGEKNKIVPKEFKEALEKQPLIANKSFYYYTELDAQVILEPGLAETLMDYYLAGKGVNNFFKKALAA